MNLNDFLRDLFSVPIVLALAVVETAGGAPFAVLPALFDVPVARAVPTPLYAKKGRRYVLATSRDVGSPLYVRKPGNVARYVLA